MDTFRILMVLPSVFTRGWDHFGRKIGPPGGVPKPPFWGPGGTPPPPPPDPPGGGPPPPPPRGGPPRGRPPPPPGGGPPPSPRGGGAPRGGSRTPPGGGTPPSRGGGKPRPKRTPPWGTPFWQPNSCKEITRGEARYRFSTHSPVPCQR